VYGSTEYEHDSLAAAESFIDELNGRTDPTTPLTAHITFTVYDEDANRLPGATVEISGQGTKTTSTLGYATWTELPLATYTYTVSKTGYSTETGSITLSEHKTYQLPVYLTSEGGTPTTKVTVTIQATAGGTVTPSGAQEVTPGTFITVTATANDGYVFDHWTENGQQKTYSASFTYTVNQDTVLTAVFKAETPESHNPYIGYAFVIAGIIVAIYATYSEYKKP